MGGALAFADNQQPIEVAGYAVDSFEWNMNPIYSAEYVLLNYEKMRFEEDDDSIIKVWEPILRVAK